MYKKFNNSKERSFGKGRDFGTPLFEAYCSDCGDRCEVPFKPSGNRPVFCRDCFRKQEGGDDSRDFGGSRDSRGSDRYDSRGRDDKRLFPAVCATCHDRCEVPFKPTSGRPVYCQACMAEQKGYGAPQVRTSAPTAVAGGKMSDEQYKTLNAKLDKILKILDLAMQVDEEEMDGFDEDDLDTADFAEEMEELPEVLEVKAPKKASKTADKPAPKKEKKPTRGQKKRAIRTGRA